MNEAELQGRLGHSRLFVSDLDGTLVDSEPYHLESYTLILSTLIGDNVSISYADIVGRTSKEIWSSLARQYDLQLDIERLNHLRKIVLSGLYSLNKPEANHRLLSVLDSFRGTKLLVTAQALDSAHRLAELLGITDRFDEFISEPDSKLKIILEYANRNGIAPHQIVWAEDASTELQAAKNSGIFTIVIRREYNRQNTAIADIVL
jgi:beta-phosphoglucomutase-like phosphatase (HAD superfamily)